MFPTATLKAEVQNIVENELKLGRYLWVRKRETKPRQKKERVLLSVNVILGMSDQ